MTSTRSTRSKRAENAAKARAGRKAKSVASSAAPETPKAQKKKAPKAPAAATPGGRSIGTPRDAPCHRCVSASLRGLGDGKCYNNASTGPNRRCYACADGGSCAPVPDSALKHAKKMMHAFAEHQAGRGSARELKKLRMVVRELLAGSDDEDSDDENGAAGGGGTELVGASGARGGGGGEEDLDQIAFGPLGEPSGGVPTAQVAVSSENIDRIRTALHVAVDSFFDAIEEL